MACARTIWLLTFLTACGDDVAGDGSGSTTSEASSSSGPGTSTSNDGGTSSVGSSAETRGTEGSSESTGTAATGGASTGGGGGGCESQSAICLYPGYWCQCPEGSQCIVSIDAGQCEPCNCPAGYYCPQRHAVLGPECIPVGDTETDTTDTETGTAGGDTGATTGEGTGTTS